MHPRRPRGRRRPRRVEERRVPRPEYPDLEAVVLDYIEVGYPKDPHPRHRQAPVVQMIGAASFSLIDGIPLDEVDFLDRVGIAVEASAPVPRGAGGGFVRVSLACVPYQRRFHCYVVDEVPGGDLNLVRLAFPEDEPIELVGSYEALLEVARARNLPDKIVMSPPDTIAYEVLTRTAQDNLVEAVRKILRDFEAFYVNFFNVAEPINVRLHALELLKGVGKKTLQKLLAQRQMKPFKSYEEVKAVLKIDPVEAMAEQIVREIRGEAKYYLFVKPRGEGERRLYLNYRERIVEYIRRMERVGGG